MKVILYTGPNCSLCDDALNLIDELKMDVEVNKINIRDCTELYHLYGARIPVVKRDTNHVTQSHDDLGWPYTLEQLRAYLI